MENFFADVEAKITMYATCIVYYVMFKRNFSDINALKSSVERSGVSIGAVVGSCVAGFLVGLAVTAVLSFCYLKRRQQPIPGSPHYISKQNSYVSVPLKDVSRQSNRYIMDGHIIHKKDIKYQ